MEQDFYNYDDASKRRRARTTKAQLMKKTRQQLIRRRIIATAMIMLMVILAVVIINAVSGIRKKSKTVNSDADSVVVQTDAQNESQNEKETKPNLVYSQVASDYKDLSSDTNVASPYAALLDIDNHKIIAGKHATEIRHQ